MKLKKKGFEMFKQHKGEDTLETKEFQFNEQSGGVLCCWL